MDQNEDPGIWSARSNRRPGLLRVSVIQTTVERLSAWIQDLRQRLRQRLEARRTKQQISARAREIWEQNGRPADRDLEFWLQAESEISERRRCGNDEARSHRPRDRISRFSGLPAMARGGPSTNCLASRLASSSLTATIVTRLVMWPSSPVK